MTQLLERVRSQSQSDLEMLTRENAELRQKASDLQGQLKDVMLEGEAEQLRALQEEVEDLRAQLEEAREGVALLPSPPQAAPGRSDTSTASWNLSRRLSETLQVLEESVLAPPSSPGRRSICSLADTSHITDIEMVKPILETMKQELEALQECLVAQEHQHLLMQQEELQAAADTTAYHLQVVAQVEQELSLWRAQELFVGDFILHSGNLWQLTYAVGPPQTTRARQSSLYFNLDQAVQTAVEETRDRIRAEYEEKFRQQREALEARAEEDTFVEGDTLYMPHRRSSCRLLERLSLPEVEQEDIELPTYNMSLETSLLSLEPTSSHHEMQRLKSLLELLTDENNKLTSQVEKLQSDRNESGKLGAVGDEGTMANSLFSVKDQDLYNKKGRDTMGGDSYNANDQDPQSEIKPRSVISKQPAAPQSLADELRQAGMNLTLLEETFETSVMFPGPVSPSPGPHSPGQQVGFLEQDISQIQQTSQQLEGRLKKEENNQVLSSDSDAENSKFCQLENEVQRLREERSLLESKVEQLQEALDCKNLTEEEVHALRWQVNALKAEKAELASELRLLEEEQGRDTTGEETQCFQGQVETLKQEKLALKEEVRQLEEKLSHMNILEEEVHSLRWQNNTLKEENSDLEKTLELTQEELETMTSGGSSAQAAPGEIKSLEGSEKPAPDKDQLGVGADVLQEKEIELEAALERIKLLEQENRKAHSDSEEVLANAIAEKESELEMIIANFTEKEENFEIVEKEFKRVTSELEQMREVHKSKEEEFERVTSELEQMREVQKSKEEEFEGVTSEVEQIKEMWKSKEEELERVTSELEQMRETLENKDTELQHLGKEYSNLQIVLRGVEADLLAKSDAFSAMEDNCYKLEQEKTNLKLQYENKVQEIEKTVESYELRIQDQGQEFTALSQMCEKQQKLLQELEEEEGKLRLKCEQGLSVASTKTEREVEVSQFTQSAVEQKLDDFEELKDKFANKMKECGQLRDSVDNLKVLLTKKQEELQQMSADHKDELAFYTDNLNEKDKDLKNVENELKRASEEVALLKSTVAAKDHKLEKVERDLKTAGQDLSDKERECQESLSSMEAEMSRRVEELQEDMSHLKKDYDEVCADRKSMMDSLRGLEEVKTVLTQECTSLIEKLTSIEEECCLLKGELEVRESEINQVQDLISSLEDEHESLQQNLVTQKARETELLDQVVSGTQEVNKLIGEIEKYEREMLEKEEQILAMREDLEHKSSRLSAAEDLIETLQEASSQVAHKYTNMEEMKRKCEELEGELQQKRKEAGVTQDLLGKLTTVQETAAVLEAELLAKTSENEKEISRHMAEKEEICKKLSEAEEMYSGIKLKLKNATEVSEAAHSKCDDLKSELNVVREELARTLVSLKSAEEELAQRSSDLCSQKQHHEELFTVTQSKMSQMQEKIDRYEKEQRKYNSEIEELAKEAKNYNTALCETRELLQRSEAEWDEKVTEKTNEIQNLHSELREKSTEIGSLEHVVCSLKKTIDDVRAKCEELEGIRERCFALEEENHRHKKASTMLDKLNCAPKATLLPAEKLSRHREELASKERTAELRQRVQDLESRVQAYDTEHSAALAAICSDWEVEYSHLYEESERHRANVVRLEALAREREDQHEEKVQELVTRLNTLMNCSSTSTSTTQDTSNLVGSRRGRGKGSRLAKLEQANDQLREELVECDEKIRVLEVALDSLRRNQGVLSEDAEVQRELTWMREKMEAAEKMRDLLDQNYDSLERDYLELQRERSETMSDGASHKEVEQLKGKLLELQEKYNALMEENREPPSGGSTQGEVEQLKGQVLGLQEKYNTLMEERRETAGDGNAKVEVEQLKGQLLELQDKYNTLMEERKETAGDGNTKGEVVQLQEKLVELQEKYDALKEDRTGNLVGLVTTSVKCEATEGSEERMAALERVNNELRFRLRALNAPAEKEAESLREELRTATGKIDHLKSELRRLQTTSCVDSTICEMSGDTPQQGRRHHQQDYDYSCGSGVVAQIQVLEMQNKLYHLEKEKKKAESEQRVLNQHMEHYKKKAQEWKDKATREKWIGDKTRKELDHLQAELQQRKTEAEENQSCIKRQQFELGHQREVIQRLEQDRQDVPPQRLPQEPVTALASTARRKTHPSTTEPVQGPDPTTGKEAGNDHSGEGKEKSRSNSSSQLLGVHNVPLPTMTRVEQLPGVKAAQGEPDKLPMWQSRNKENKDYSKYRLPPEARRKANDDCKPQ